MRDAEYQIPDTIWRSGDGDVRQLIYISHATSRMSDADLLELLREARRLNAQHGVTGLLLYVADHFIQCIEGGEPAIAQLARNISVDTRNRAFTILLDRMVRKRAFETWQMGFRSMEIGELQQEEGFRDLRSAADLEAVFQRKDQIYTLMQRLYAANRG